MRVAFYKLGRVRQNATRSRLHAVRVRIFELFRNRLCPSIVIPSAELLAGIRVHGRRFVDEFQLHVDPADLFLPFRRNSDESLDWVVFNVNVVLHVLKGTNFDVVVIYEAVLADFIGLGRVRTLVARTVASRRRPSTRTVSRQLFKS